MVKKQLYFVFSDAEDGENQDLLVVATDTAQATRIWQKYFDLDEADAVPDGVSVVPGVEPVVDVGPISWDSIHSQ